MEEENSLTLNGAEGAAEDTAGAEQATQTAQRIQAAQAGQIAQAGQTAQDARTPQAEGTEGSSVDGLREELSRARERVTQLERERSLLLEGVAEEDLDYYAFRIGKLVSEEKAFDTALKEFLKQHGTARKPLQPRSTGASLSGRATKPLSTSETMNKLLRGASS